MKVRKSFPCAELIKHHAKKMYGGVETQLHTFFTLALDGGEWSTSRPCWVDPRACLVAVEKGKISCLCQESKPNSLAIQPVASLGLINKLHYYGEVKRATRILGI
jgi:hypothetical protein